MTRRWLRRRPACGDGGWEPGVLGSRRCLDPDAATVLLYAHDDVQPPLNEAEWRTPPFELTEAGGRWYGRGTADGKGNIVMHLTALRALGDQVPVNLRLVVEGSEEITGALEGLVPGHPTCCAPMRSWSATPGTRPWDTRPSPSACAVWPTSSSVWRRSCWSSTRACSGAAPGALAALVAMLATLRDARGNTTVRGLDNTPVWPGAAFPPATFRAEPARSMGVSAWRRDGGGHGLVAPGGHDRRARPPAGGWGRHPRSRCGRAPA